MRIAIVDGADPFLMLKEPGDYYGPVMGFSGDRPAVFFLLPESGSDGHAIFGHCQSPPHTFTEEADGTLTISASILTTSRHGQWHGYLEKGIWRKV